MRYIPALKLISSSPYILRPLPLRPTGYPARGTAATAGRVTVCFLALLIESVLEQLHHVALDDGIGVDPHGLGLLGQELMDDKPHVVGRCGVQFDVLAGPGVGGVGKFLEAVALRDLRQLPKSHLRHVVRIRQRLVADVQELDGSGCVHQHRPDGGHDAGLLSAVGRINKDRTVPFGGAEAATYQPVAATAATHTTKQEAAGHTGHKEDRTGGPQGEAPSRSGSVVRHGSTTVGREQIDVEAIFEYIVVLRTSTPAVMAPLGAFVWRFDQGIHTLVVVVDNGAAIILE